MVESHALALNDLQRKVDQPSDPQLVTWKLPMAERQTRQSEQEARLEGIIFSPEVAPSHALVDLCINMLEQNVLTWIKPEECTSRSQEIQSSKKDPKVSLDASGSIKISSETTATTCLFRWIGVGPPQCIPEKIACNGSSKALLLSWNRDVDTTPVVPIP